MEDPKTNKRSNSSCLDFPSKKPRGDLFLNESECNFCKKTPFRLYNYHSTTTGKYSFCYACHIKYLRGHIAIEDHTIKDNEPIITEVQPKVNKKKDRKKPKDLNEFLNRVCDYCGDYMEADDPCSKTGICQECFLNDEYSEKSSSTGSESDNESDTSKDESDDEDSDNDKKSEEY